MKSVNTVGSTYALSPVEGYPPPKRGTNPEGITPHGVKDDKRTVEPLEEADREKVRETADRLNRMSRVFDRKIQFEVSSENKDVVTKIIDRETGKVIREIPPPELVELAKRMDEIYEVIFRSKLR
jgi:flagellar protein FlaG